MNQAQLAQKVPRGVRPLIEVKQNHAHLVDFDQCGVY